MTNIVRYHGYEWALMVEMGWITMHVENGMATMLYTRRRRR